MRSLQTGGDGENTREGAVGAVREGQLGLGVVWEGAVEPAARGSATIVQNVSAHKSQQQKFR